MEKNELFTDFNFKLIVIEELLDKNPLFLNKLKELEAKYNNNYEWYSDAEPIVQILDYLKSLKLETSDLEKIEYLCFDGGNEIYGIIKPDWDGEDELFDVTSVEGFQHLKNLKRVDYTSMCDPKVLEPFKLAGIEVED
ncbi:DUF6892 domain-containing protein [Priestia megaterium]|uniref:YbaK/ebsC family protein n=1 Tax=Priestia megaterium TaxID=1404 RepID=A0A6M6E6G5_PRIMG|nr:ybaK/ebsC family protein [Priestia megaterium]QJX80117.1 ybaK/ebsC family protein [Priestia megaterium]